MDLNVVLQKLAEQSVTALVLFVILLLFAKWVKYEIDRSSKESAEMIKYLQDDKAKCFSQYENLRVCIDNNTRLVEQNIQLMKSLSQAFQDFKIGRHGGA